MFLGSMIYLGTKYIINKYINNKPKGILGLDEYVEGNEMMKAYRPKGDFCWFIPETNNNQIKPTKINKNKLETGGNWHSR